MHRLLSRYVVPKKPKGKQPKAPVLPPTTPFTCCFYDVEFKAKISGSKGCSVNPCNFGIHRTNITAYVIAAGSKSKLISSLNSFRNKDRLKAVVDVIKALPENLRFFGYSSVPPIPPCSNLHVYPTIR